MEEFISIKGSLVILSIIVGIFLTFRDPKFGIIVFIILLFARDGFLLLEFPAAYRVLHLPKVFGVLTLISWFIHRKGQPVQLPLQFWLMLLFFAVICLSRGLAGTSPFEAKPPQEFLKFCVLFFLIVNVIDTEKDLREVMWVLIMVSVCMVLYHYYHYKTGWRSIFVVPNFGTLNRNGFAITLASLVPFAYVFLRERKPILIKGLLAFSLFFFIVGIILTYSRGGFLALCIALASLILYDRSKARPIFLVLILSALIIPRLSEKYFNRISTIINYHQEASAMIRVATNKAALNMVKRHPLFGVGAGNFPYTFFDYTPDDLKKWVEPGINSHNLTLQVASETGIIGLVIFLLLVIKTLIDAMKLRKLCLQHEKFESLANVASALGIGLFTYFMAKQTGQGAYYGYIHVFIPLTVAAKQIFHLEEVSGARET